MKKWHGCLEHSFLETLNSFHETSMINQNKLGDDYYWMFYVTPENKIYTDEKNINSIGL